MTLDEIKALREMEARATPRPWSIDDRMIWGEADRYQGCPQDRYLIVAARNALPMLLNEIVLLRSALEEIRSRAHFFYYHLGPRGDDRFLEIEDRARVTLEEEP